jgi:predicted lipoprotein with Yx(FWY)xxD motif
MNKNNLLSMNLKPASLAGILILAAMILAACAPSATKAAAPTATTAYAITAPTSTTPPTKAPAPAAEASINVATDAKYGKVLVDGKGMTLYMFTKDAPSKSNCAAGCLKAWPPLLTQGSPTLGDGVDKTLVGTADLADGTKIVTYNKMPLYYYVKDAKPGDFTGVGVGTAWYLVDPAGKVIGKEAAQATPTVAGYGSAPEAMEASINVATDAKYGKILVDGKGMTLYMFTKDAANTSNCAGGCLKAWPPLLTQGSPVLGAGVDKTLVGTADLADGTKIVTYNKMPLYYYANDTKPGDFSGVGVGTAWYLVDPAGAVIGK